MSAPPFAALAPFIEDALRQHPGCSLLEEVWKRNRGVSEEEAISGDPEDDRVVRWRKR